MDKKASISREISLLVIGAIISASTALITNYLNEKREDRKSNVQKKIELNKQLSEDLGKRFFLTMELRKERRNPDSSLGRIILLYKQSKEEWNLKYNSYEALIKHYYGDSVKKNFKEIYEPLVIMGQIVENNKFDSLFEARFINLRNYNSVFVEKIYDLADE